MTICEQKVVQKWDKNAKLALNYTFEGEYWLVGWRILDMIYNVDPISHSCYVGIDECLVGL